MQPSFFHGDYGPCQLSLGLARALRSWVDKDPPFSCSGSTPSHQDGRASSFPVTETQVHARSSWQLWLGCLALSAVSLQAFRCDLYCSAPWNAARMPPVLHLSPGMALQILGFCNEEAVPCNPAHRRRAPAPPGSLPWDYRAGLASGGCTHPHLRSLAIRQQAQPPAVLWGRSSPQTTTEATVAASPSVFRHPASGLPAGG